MLLTALLGLSLAGQPSVPSLSGKKIAVLGFGLDKSIVMRDQERDQGPGIVQKAEDYYRAHQAATDTLYAHFLKKFPELFAGANVLPMDSVPTLPGYRIAAECKAKKVFGREIFGCNDLNPKGGMYSLSLGQAQEKVSPFAASIGLDYYLIFVNRASYRMSVGGGANGVVAGAGKMDLETTVYLLPVKGKDVAWSRSYKDESVTSKPMLNDIFSEDNYILIGEAFDGMAPKIRKDLEKGLATP